jgi:FtsP/CotA-like multicopper oxidase with cupredoxin domain
VNALRVSSLTMNGTIAVGVLGGSLSVGSTRAEVGLDEVATVLPRSAAPAGSAALGPTELLVSFSATAPTPARLELDWQLTIEPGSPAPTIEVDLGNDGTIDYTARTPNSVYSFGTFALGPQPLLAVLRTQTSNSNGVLRSVVRLRAVADPLAVIQQVTPMCQGGFPLTAQPAFDGALELQIQPTGQLQFLVVGTSVAPVLLPASQQCLLIPALTAVAPMPANGLFRLPMGNLRGLPLWMQIVGINSVYDYVWASESYSVIFY